jgi:hypothetical protein
MIEKALRLLTEQIDQKVKQLQEDLGSGNAKSFEDYKATCGEIKGLLTARLNIVDLQKNIEESDD